MPKGNFIEHPEAVNMKESRTETMLRVLKVDAASFLDPKLPKGFFSNSQYNSWLICGKAYEFKYVNQIATPDYASTSRGNAVHAGVEHMLKAKMAGVPVNIEQGKEVVSKTFDEKAKGVQDWGEEEPGKVKDLSLALFKAYTTYALPKINPVAIEKGFAKKVGDVPMVGWIDLIDRQPAVNVEGMSDEDRAMAPMKLITADLKTGKAKWSEKEVALDPQLTLYSHIEGTPDVRIDQLIAHKKAPTFLQAASTRTPKDAETLIDHINEVADFVKKGVFPKTTIDNWACNKDHCSFYHLCRGKK
jgi:hypothetical protein